MGGGGGGGGGFSSKNSRGRKRGALFTEAILFILLIYFQSEDVAPQYQRREFISGFSGSHGKDANEAYP